MWCWHGFYKHGIWGFPLGFHFHGHIPFPRRREYLHMLEHYKEKLEAELREVEKEIEELKGEV